jgi:polygalacturonase
LNVLDFGAIGDGLVEDTQAIQNAMYQAKNISASISASNDDKDEPISQVVVLLPAAFNFLLGPLNITGNHMALQIDGNLLT